MIISILLPHNSPGMLVFWCQRSQWNGDTPNRGT